MASRRKRNVHVAVVHRKTRDCFVLRWTDPITGKRHEKTACAAKKRDAFREAAELACQISDGKYYTDIEWDIFVERYEKEKLAFNRPQTMTAWVVVANAIEHFEKPRWLSGIDGDYVSRFSSAQFSRGLAVATIASYLRRLRAALGWAANTFPGYDAPKIILPKVPKSVRMKGRPITTEEFERMLMATESVVGEANAKSWRRFLRGIWLIGRRLEQMMNLSWDRIDRPHILDIDTATPKLCIPAESEKGGVEQIIPLTPDAVRFLRRTPPKKRRGRVFRPRLKKGPIRHVVTASDTISDIGRRARIQVSVRASKSGNGKPIQKIKYASAHDLRRSFGTRWAPKVKPIVLQLLMGHKSINTTMQFYVVLDANDIAKEIWNQFGGLSGDKIKRDKKNRAREMA